MNAVSSYFRAEISMVQDHLHSYSGAIPWPSLKCDPCGLFLVANALFDHVEDAGVERGFEFHAGNPAVCPADRRL